MQSSSTSRFCFASLFLAFVGTAGCSPANQPPPVSSHVLAGKPIPDISRRAMDSSKADTKTFRGRVVVVKFFAKYCAPCKRTLPAIQKLHEARPELAIVGVAIDDSSNDVQEMIDTYKLTFPIVHDSAHALQGRYRVVVLPTTFVVNKEGTVVWVGGPENSEEDLLGAIDGVR